MQHIISLRIPVKGIQGKDVHPTVTLSNIYNTCQCYGCGSGQCPCGH